MNQNLDHYDHSLKFLLSKFIAKDCNSISLFLIDNISQTVKRTGYIYFYSFVRFLYIIHIIRGGEGRKKNVNIVVIYKILK